MGDYRCELVVGEHQAISWTVMVDRGRPPMT